jgi:hypothetical protein
MDALEACGHIAIRRLHTSRLMRYRGNHCSWPKFMPQAGEQGDNDTTQSTVHQLIPPTHDNYTTLAPTSPLLRPAVRKADVTAPTGCPAHNPSRHQPPTHPPHNHEECNTAKVLLMLS